MGFIWGLHPPQEGPSCACHCQCTTHLKSECTRPLNRSPTRRHTTGVPRQFPQNVQAASAACCAGTWIPPDSSTSNSCIATASSNMQHIALGRRLPPENTPPATQRGNPPPPKIGQCTPPLLPPAPTLHTVRTPKGCLLLCYWL